MSDIRQHHEGPLPRQRPSGGVVGYVAGLEQYDGVMTASSSAVAPVVPTEGDPASRAPAAAAPPATAPPTGPAVVGPAVVGPAVVGSAVVGSAVVGSAVTDPAVTDPAVTGIVTADAAGDLFTLLSDDDTVEFTIDWTVLADPQRFVAVAPLPDLSEPATGRAAAAVSGRWLRAAVLSCVALALAVVVAAGVGYVTLKQKSATPNGAVPPGVQESVPPMGPDVDVTASVEPGIEPARPSASGSTPVPSATVTTPGTGAPVGAAPGDPVGRTTPDDPGTSPTPPLRDTPLRPEPTPRRDAPPAQEPAPQSPPTAEPAAGLTAIHFRSDEAPPLDAGGYVTTVRIDNPGPDDITGWRVTMTVPGGGQLRRADGAAASYDGETVAFTPRGNATVPAGGSVSFTFEVEGVLTGDPPSCTIDGHPCG